MLAGYWPGPWPAEDAGPARLQTVANGPGFGPESRSVFREGVASTMVVMRDPGEVYVLRHTPGPETTVWVERIDPVTLEVVVRSPDLAGGPTWPGGIAAHADGSLYTVVGAHAHRLDPVTLEVLAECRLPRWRPYNSFVVLPDGTLVTKDFGGVLPGRDPETHEYVPTELVALSPGTLDVRATLELPEASIARLSADDDDVYVVGTDHLWRVHWDGTRFVRDDAFAPHYRTVDGQTYGWDPVIALGAVWFLDNGFGSERWAGTFRGQGVNRAALHLVRVGLDGVVTLTEVCGLPNGVIANPPLIDAARRIAVGFDSGNGVIAAFDIHDDGSLTLRWRHDQNHACHLLLFADTGELVSTDHDMSIMSDQFVVRDISTGEELLRLDSGSPVQSVLFPAAGVDRDVYYCSFAGIARLSA